MAARRFFHRPKYGWIHSICSAFIVFCVVIVVAMGLVAWLPGVAGAAIASPLDGGACYEEREQVRLEYERTVVTQDEVTATERLYQKQIKVHGEWQDYPLTRWEPDGFTEEGWIGGVRHRYRPTEETRTVVVSEAVTEREVEWFSSPPEDDWTPTGNAEVTFIEVEVPCRDLTALIDQDCEGLWVTLNNNGDTDETAHVAGEFVTVPAGEFTVFSLYLPPHGTEWAATVTWDGQAIAQAQGVVDCPPVEPPVEHDPEPEADHTDTPPPPEPPVELDPEPIVEERLPVTGPRDHLITVGGLLLFLGLTIAGIEAYDRRHRKA